jgi:hypothetical protein
MPEPTHQHGDASTDPFLARVPNMIDANHCALPGRLQASPAGSDGRLDRSEAALSPAQLSFASWRSRAAMVLPPRPRRLAVERADSSPGDPVTASPPGRAGRDVAAVETSFRLEQAQAARPRTGRCGSPLTLARDPLPCAGDGSPSDEATAGEVSMPSKVVQEALRAAGPRLRDASASGPLLLRRKHRLTRPCRRRPSSPAQREAGSLSGGATSGRPDGGDR